MTSAPFMNRPDGARQQRGSGSSEMSDPTRVFIVMERRMVREGLSYVLRADPGVEVVGVSEALDGASKELQADVVLVDLDDAATGQAAFGRGLAERFGGAGVVAI